MSQRIINKCKEIQALVKEIERLLDEAHWSPMSTAPKDGTLIEVKIPGHGDDNVICWGNFAIKNGKKYSSWGLMQGIAIPCWKYGICWNDNQDLEKASVQPTAWRPYAL
jgi:hypothetical protein